MDYDSVEQAQQFMTMPPYTKDALGTYFRFDMGGGGDWCISCTHDANDMFSPFTDITYEADTNGDCVPKVKLTDDPEEEFQKLISVDGVSADCLLESIREARQDFYMDTVSRIPCLFSKFSFCNLSVRTQSKTFHADP